MAWFVMVSLLSIGIDFEYSNLDPHEQTAKKMSGLQYISYDLEFLYQMVTMSDLVGLMTELVLYAHGLHHYLY